MLGVSSLATGMAQTQAPSAKPQVLFSRSAGEASPPPPARAASETAPQTLAGGVTDAQREAPQFARYDFVIHLQPETAGLAVELRTTVRNAGSEPLSVLPLQLGSQLHFEHIRAENKALRFATHTLQSDADHSGSLEEAAVELPKPLLPGTALELTIDYSGTVEQSSTRLDRIGTPAELAARSDWDQVGNGFTGLRGFGDTVWYPVASVPTMLGDGSRLFDEIARQKEWNRDATVSMTVTDEFRGDTPTVAVLDGRTQIPGPPASKPDATFPGVMRVSLPSTRLGFATPSVFVATRVPSLGNDLLRVQANPNHMDAAQGYGAAVTMLQPVLEQWLGAKPATPLTLVDLPVDQGEPSQQGNALFLSLQADEPAKLAAPLSHALPRATFASPRPVAAGGCSGVFRDTVDGAHAGPGSRTVGACRRTCRAGLG